MRFKVFSFDAKQTSPHATNEHHLIFQCMPTESFYEQIDHLFEAFSEINDGRYGQCLFLRFFLSDASNQATVLEEKLKSIKGAATISIIQQPPLLV